MGLEGMKENKIIKGEKAKRNELKEIWTKGGTWKRKPQTKGHKRNKHLLSEKLKWNNREGNKS